MEKKIYMAPQMEQVVLTPLQMLSASVGICDDEVVDAGQSFTNDRGERQWGNRWID